MSEALNLQSEYPLQHLTPAIGTEVHGINIADLDDDTIKWLADLLVERKVLFFRDQHISIDEHIAFAARFGELEVHPFNENLPAHPEVMRLHNDLNRRPAINIWHSDVTWRKAPSLGSILRGRVVPEVGGDTLFANMELAYEGLGDEMKAKLEGLYAVHDNAGFLAGMRARGATEAEVEEKRKAFPPSRHPVVRTHPVSGRKSLYVNRAFTRYIEGMSAEDSSELLETLYRQAWIPDYQCRFRWRPDSFAFWDNRAAQHYAAADYWPEVRTMERVTIIGDEPF
ncbi:MAG: TauD/TfdA dioxygenase family protein [Pseudomonadota bacterium]